LPATRGNRIVVFPRPGVVEVVDAPVGARARDQVLLRTRRTLISSGTDLTVLSGNFEPRSAWASFDLVRDDEIDLAPLVTHRFRSEAAPEAYRLLLEDPSAAVGVVLDWDA